MPTSLVKGIWFVTGDGFPSRGCSKAKDPVHKWKTGFVIPVFSTLGNASGKCEGKGNVQDYLGKSTNKEGSQEKKEIGSFIHVHVMGQLGWYLEI